MCSLGRGGRRASPCLGWRPGRVNRIHPPPRGVGGVRRRGACRLIPAMLLGAEQDVSRWVAVHRLGRPPARQRAALRRCVGPPPHPNSLPTPPQPPSAVHAPRRGDPAQLAPLLRPPSRSGSVPRCRMCRTSWSCQPPPRWRFPKVGQATSNPVPWIYSVHASTNGVSARQYNKRNTVQALMARNQLHWICQQYQRC
jgi:hypothetical protein